MTASRTVPAMDEKSQDKAALRLLIPSNPISTQNGLFIILRQFAIRELEREPARIDANVVVNSELIQRRIAFVGGHSVFSLPANHAVNPDIERTVSARHGRRGNVAAERRKFFDRETIAAGLAVG
jgi:hypothetical protein